MLARNPMNNAVSASVSEIRRPRRLVSSNSWAKTPPPGSSSWISDRFGGKGRLSLTEPESLLETGIEVQVPPYLAVGEKVRIDTRDGHFVERVK